ncbi:hypothetical protein CW304_15110 [Bacillus sp. UFRGS-B20]|nr:hypothetical protein CW304_15110 [Bacillus sp. UFRGS-B20]
MASNDWIFIQEVWLTTTNCYEFLYWNGMQGNLQVIVHPLFGIFFTVMYNIAIGPSMGIPRVAMSLMKLGG